jgi:hypothetical protein
MLNVTCKPFKLSVVFPSADELPVDEISLYVISVDKMSIDKMSIDKMTRDQMTCRLKLNDH